MNNYINNSKSGNNNFKEIIYKNKKTIKKCKICNKIIICNNNDTNNINNICLNCFNSLPSNFNKNDFIIKKRNEKIIKILNCKIHGKYLGTSSIEKCPICKNKCIIENCENISYIKGFCLECLKSLPKTFTLNEIENNNNKNKKEFKIVPLNCEKHGLYLGFTSNNICPICKNKCIIENCKNGSFKVGLCEKHFNSIEANFDKNDNNIDRIFLLYCNKHGYYLANSSTTNCYQCTRSCIIDNCDNLKYKNYSLCKNHLNSLPNNFENIDLYEKWIEDGNKIYVLNCKIHNKYIAKGPVASCPICENKCDIENCNNQKYIGCVCKDHYNLIPSIFNKTDPPDKICICECHKHGLYLSGSGIGSCPLCYDENLNNYLNKIEFLYENGDKFDFNLNNKYNDLNIHGIVIKDDRFYEKDSIINFLTSDKRKFENFIPNKIIITNLSISEYIMKIKNIIIESFSNDEINTVILNNNIHETVNLEKYKKY